MRISENPQFTGEAKSFKSHEKILYLQRRQWIRLQKKSINMPFISLLPLILNLYKIFSGVEKVEDFVFC